MCNRLTGALENPQFHGQISVANGQVRDYTFDQFSAEIDANQREISAQNVNASHGRATATGSVALAARSGGGERFANSEIVAQLSLRNVDIEEAARIAGVTQPLAGTASANVKVSGSIQQLEASHSISPESDVLLFGDQALGSSIPFYLGRDVSLVEGRSTSMLFGSTFADAPAIFLSSQDLVNAWGKGKRKILFVPIDKRDEVDHLLGNNKILLKESSGKALYTDRPLDLTGLQSKPN